MRYATHYKSVWDVVSAIIATVLAAMFLLWATQAAGEVVPTRETVICPWEGVFSAQEYPGALPFVQVGDHVEPQTIVGVIYMNYLDPSGKIEVFSGLHGTVVEILVDDGAFVAAGNPLMIVELDPVEASSVD